MTNRMKRIRHLKKHAKSGHKKKKGMSGRRRHGLARRTHHTKTKHTRHASRRTSKSAHKMPGGRSSGARSGRRMDSYHMRRRLLHPALAGGAMMGAGTLGLEDMLDEDPFGDESLMMDDMDDFDDFGSETITEESETGSESEDNDSIADHVRDGPPPLESEDHCHVFIYHTSAGEDCEQVEHYVSILENSPNDLKVLTSERDFKTDLSVTQNLMLNIGLSQYTILLCSSEFVENDLRNYEAASAAMASGMADPSILKSKVVVLLCPDVECPTNLEKHPQYSMVDSDCFENLTKLLCSGGLKGGLNLVEPAAPPPDSLESETSPMKEFSSPAEPKELPIYPNGLVIKQVTATRYGDFEKPDEELGLCSPYCPHSDMLCPRPEPEYQVPSTLTRRGLQVTVDEFEDILHSLSESAHVTFFQKAVDCSMNCLYLSSIVTTACVTIPLWFLIVGVLQHYGSETMGESIFWSFIICIILIPAMVALVMLGVILHLVNYKYLKYRIRIEEFNKRFRETNLVLHCRKAFWSCHGRLKLYFIYYNFEQCQQTLYCHVHDNMKHTNGQSIEENGNHLADSTTLKLDKIMKRVNTLTKKFEWDYFEALTTQTLPQIDEKEHRKKGMCFCQYVLHREQEELPVSVVEQVKGQVKSMRKNALKKSHRRKSSRNNMYIGPVVNKNGTAHFSNGKNGRDKVVYI